MKKLVFSIGMLAFTLSPVANAQNVSLFTTYDDFSQWSLSGGTTITPDPTWSADNNAVNGLGNLSNAGGAGTSGSLSIQYGPTTGNFNSIASAPGEGGNSIFLSAIDPGSSGNNSATWAGNIYLDYSLPDNEGGTYFQLGVLLQYSADGYYQQFFPAGSDTDLGFQDSNGEEVFQATIPYTITAGQFNGFGFSVMYSSNYQPLFPFHVDDIQVQAAPEPTTFALMGLGLAGAALVRRARKS